jgi:hypothetical protein
MVAVFSMASPMPMLEGENPKERSSPIMSADTYSLHSEI